jgi:hypothetical protein
MPRNQPLPAILDLNSPLPNISRSIEQKEHTRRVRFGPECIDGRKAARTQTIGPMVDLTVMATLSAGLMVIDDHSAPVSPIHVARLSARSFRQSLSRGCKIPALAHYPGQRTQN